MFGPVVFFLTESEKTLSSGGGVAGMTRRLFK